VAWDAATATVRFTGSGAIHFTNGGAKSFIWQIPAEVKQVRLAPGVTVNGAFHAKASVMIAGEDRKTSVVYGTDEPRWSQSRGIKAFTICTFQNFGGVMTISNLTSLNPRGFHVRGWDNVVHAVACDFLDRRGGHHNNSDGFEGGDGSTVHDCYFESGDDIIKVYHDVTVTDTTIRMITNTVPIQLGWGDYSDGAVGTFRNLRVLGSGGRGAEGNAIISGRKGRYDVTVHIDGCHIENPNATLVSLREDTMTLRGAITNANIKLKSYAGEFQKGTNLLTVCGTTERKATYDCGTPPGDEKVAILSRPNTSQLTSDSASVFAQNIQPVLNDYCVSCHGPEKVKAGLRLDSYEALVAGGDSGATMVAGKSADSLFIERLRLPLDDDDHMPPENKPQPTEPEIALLAWWIDQGASSTAKLATLTVDPAIAHFFTTNKTLPLQSREAVATALATLRDDPVFRADFLALDDARIRVRARAASDADLDRLQSLRANIADMDLTGMEAIAAMGNLQQLNLRGTAITDAGAVRLGALSRLVSINCYGTKITDATLTVLGRLPTLRRVGLWDTGVSKEGVARLQRTLYPEVKSEKLRLEIEQLRQQRDALNVEIVSAFDFGLQATTNAPKASPSITIANVMINYHKEKNSAVNLAREGKGNREDLERLVDYYQAIQKLEPPMGSSESWKTLMTELVGATQGLLEGAPNAVERFAAAVDCRACHTQHRPK
jgi:hypothetical protein